MYSYMRQAQVLPATIRLVVPSSMKMERIAAE
jgi:hypothetical protein